MLCRLLFKGLLLCGRAFITTAACNGLALFASLTCTLDTIGFPARANAASSVFAGGFDKGAGGGGAAKAPGFPASANAAFSVFAGGFDKGAGGGGPGGNTCSFGKGASFGGG